MSTITACAVCGLDFPDHNTGCPNYANGVPWQPNAILASCAECGYPFGTGHLQGCSLAGNAQWLPVPAHPLPWGPVSPAPYAPGPTQFIPIGWQCPSCRACFSPTQMVCMYCRPQIITTGSTEVTIPAGTGG